MDEMIIDADKQVLGRLASRTAKELLKGRSVTIVNAEKALISGNPKHVFKVYKAKLDRGDPYHGPFYPRRPDMIIKRVVRGMLPKKPQGRARLKNLRVHVALPEGLKTEPVKFKESGRGLSCKSTPLGKLSEKLGAKKTW
jgi:large subunit ribosomal protein L13